MTVVLSNIFFFGFLGLGVKFWLQNREIKEAAEHHYYEMQALSEGCLAAESTGEEVCRKMAFHRTELEKYMLQSANDDSIMRLFIAFALLLPLVTWASYFLTRAIFN